MFSQSLPPVHRDEDEGSIILSLISQLRCAPSSDPCSDRPRRTFTNLFLLLSSGGADPLTPQSRHGPLKGHISNIRPRAQEHARTHNGLHGSSGSHIWVRPLLRVCMYALQRGTRTRT